MILDTIKGWFTGTTTTDATATVTVVEGQTVAANPSCVVSVGGTYGVNEYVPCRYANDATTIASCQFLASDVAVNDAVASGGDA